MRYFIAYLLTDEAKRGHLALSNELSDIFELDPVSARVDPHLTLKSPFESIDPLTVEKVLGDFAAEETPQPITLGNFRDFNGKVIYMDVVAPEETHLFIRRLQDQLQLVPWLEFRSHEFSITLHATLCYAKDPAQGKEILAYLAKKRAKTHELFLDRLSILRKDDGKWRDVSTFVLKTAVSNNQQVASSYYNI